MPLRGIMAMSLHVEYHSAGVTGWTIQIPSCDSMRKCARWWAVLCFRLSKPGMTQQGVASENGIYGHSRFCNTDFDDKLACLNLS
ncbi:hypothetical protein ACOY59_24340, partial [Enterobacter roggenkampii]